jgi:ethanolamine utilization protein EutP (predicted NTPase)
MKRIVVVGSTGSGKSTLAQQLAERMNAPHIELDALHWEPNWTPAAPEVFMQRVTMPSPAKVGRAAAITPVCATASGNAPIPLFG